MRSWIPWTAWASLAACGGIASSPADAGRAPDDGAPTSLDGTLPDAAAPDGAGGLDATHDAPIADAFASDAPASDGATCPAPLARCGDACVDLTSDDHNCGACGASCGSAFPCTQGQCVAPCLVPVLGKRGDVVDPFGGLIVCNGACIDPMTDNEHCGASGDCQGANAGAVCTAGQVCEGGVCQGLDAAGE